jgi:hypothetical protein
MKYCVGHRLVHLWTSDFTGSGNMAVCFLIVVGVHSSTISTVRIYVICYGHEHWSPSTHLNHTPTSLYSESYLPSHTIPFCSPTFVVTNGSNYAKKSRKCTHMLWMQMQHESCCPCILVRNTMESQKLICPWYTKELSVQGTTTLVL